MRPYRLEVVARGTWKYAGIVDTQIDILRYPVEHAACRYTDEELDESTPMPVSEDGFLYRVGPTSGFDFASISDAMRWANEQPWGPVQWHPVPDESSA